VNRGVWQQNPGHGDRIYIATTNFREFVFHEVRE
jgi:hypothetical protein